MTFDEYQLAAQKTDKTFDTGPDNLLVPLLGLAGEAGSLLTLYKKWLRDGDAYEVVEEKIGEELGDILWYISAVARRKNLRLSAVAAANLKKTASRWLQPTDQALFDELYPEGERLPRRFIAELRDNGHGLVDLLIDGKSFGAKLKDNAYESDGYRFHDVFHLASATMLGWSPVLRALLDKKRKSNPSVDEVEDGGCVLVDLFGGGLVNADRSGNSTGLDDFKQRHCVAPLCRENGWDWKWYLCRKPSRS
jgi:NTP pyrophosphatase (non-canonical NTP hydrolase)